MEAKEAYDELIRFLDSDDGETVLIRGYNDKDKLTIVFKALADAFSSGNNVFVTSPLVDVPVRFNPALKALSASQLEVPKLGEFYKVNGVNSEFVRMNTNVEKSLDMTSTMLYFTLPSPFLIRIMTISGF